ncbi:hypothetical protein GGR39_001379 [Novosphingobium fluoreni]|uniref:Uncharacterized protein n=1 Tax=Novosphingobium fluoreni TaxID=1391222 RepID=A0A7W6BXF6_9SPHN|nr:hypothetical protein [Novosphingobium fluoreni]MBB3939739.1 hypothetical protein [Novosphingobium fluoreni]
MAYPRAFLRIAGTTLAQHQLGMALALDCQRVICLARGPSPELNAVQRAVEAAGLRFHIVAGPQQLSALVTATDELIVITEGVFAEPGDVAELLEGTRPVVLALPDDGAVAEGFERLDINHAAAGVMRIPGSLVERLHDLPADCDAASALTRIALQSGAQMQYVPAEERTAANWRMVRSEADALMIETDWLRLRLAGGPAVTLSDRLARAGVLSFGSSLLHGGNASGMTGLGVMLAMALALALGFAGLTVPAFVVIALGWVMARATGLLRNAERHAHRVLAPAIPRADVLGWAVDVTLVIVGVVGVTAAEDGVPIPLEYRIFAPVMLMLMVHLASRLLAGRLAAWTCDRAALALLLAVAAALGYLGIVIRIAAVALAIAAVLLPPRRSA